MTKKLKYKYLSYMLTEKSPFYGGKKSVVIKRVKSLNRGDWVNTFEFTTRNHCGTHIDAPYHFFNNGKKISNYPAETWFFNSPCVIGVNLKPKEILKCGAWIEKIKPKNDILLLVSGWSRFRQQKKYIFDNPGIEPGVGLFLRKNYPNLRAVGIDWISICSFKNEPIGIDAHRAFLDPSGLNNPILIIEDMNLKYNFFGLKEIIVLPLLVDKVDSCPCTVAGRFS